jgi:ABC-type multidrug transport system permease subunit
MSIANTIAPLVIVLFLLFAGLYENSSTIPVYLIWVYYISMFHYGYEALFLNEFEGLTFTCVPNQPCLFPTGQAAIDYYGFNTAISNKWLDLAFLGAICAACKLIAFIALALKKPTGA